MISQNKQTPEKLIIIVGGPAGTGKSTVAASLLSRMTTTPTFKRADGTLACISVQFVEGDELHPAGNVAKMSAGIPLTDEDRMPWLKLLAETVVTIEPSASPTLFTTTTETPNFLEHPTSSAGIAETEKPVKLQVVICTCSCLKRKYRDYLRMSIIDNSGAPKVRLAFVFLYASPEVLIERTMKRNGHFMKSEMIKSQIDALEMPTHEELFSIGGGGPGDVVLVGEKLQALGSTKLAQWLINKSQIFQ